MLGPLSNRSQHNFKFKIAQNDCPSNQSTVVIFNVSKAEKKLLEFWFQFTIYTKSTLEVNHIIETIKSLKDTARR